MIDVHALIFATYAACGCFLVLIVYVARQLHGYMSRKNTDRQIKMQFPQQERRKGGDRRASDDSKEHDFASVGD
jgi:hypothetical protein